MHVDNLDPVSRATSKWWIVISLVSHEEWNAETPSIAQDIEWTSQIDGKLQENLADFTKKIERLRVTFTANGERQI